MRIAMLGLGLIGGSIVRALRDQSDADAEDDDSGGAAHITAWSPSNRGPAAALADGTVDAAPRPLADAVLGAELIVLAAPPLDCIWLLEELVGPVRYAVGADATITDVASTKAAIVARANERHARFVGGHPMAGRETSGYDAGSAELFVDRPWVIVPATAATPADIGRVEWLARAVGARPIHMGAAEHDRAVAGISHLPLVLAAALVEAIAGSADAPAAGWADARLLAASGWRDMTRLARGDVDMGAGIAASNAAELAARIKQVRDVLDGWLADLDPAAGGPDTRALERRLASARAVLEGTPPGGSRHDPP